MIKLTAGFSRKVGEANYSSRGASVNLELELESSLVSDPDKMHEKIRNLFLLARRAVDEELKNGHTETAKKDDATPAKVTDTDGPVCSECAGAIQSQKVVAYSNERYGKPVCYRCQQKLNGNEGR